MTWQLMSSPYRFPPGLYALALEERNDKTYREEVYRYYGMLGMGFRFTTISAQFVLSDILIRLDKLTAQVLGNFRTGTFKILFRLLDDPGVSKWCTCPLVMKGVSFLVTVLFKFFLSRLVASIPRPLWMFRGRFLGPSCQCLRSSSVQHFSVMVFVFFSCGCGAPRKVKDDNKISRI